MADTDTIAKNPVNELAKRFLITLVLGVVVYRLGIVVPIPGINVQALKELVTQSDNGLGAVLRYANMFNGGAITSASIFSLGIMPYISASIIFQILTFSFPALKQLQKEGEVGRRKISQYTRYATVAICAVQSALAAWSLVGQNNGAGTPLVGSYYVDNPMLFVVQSMLVVTTGSMCLLWIAEQVTKRGIGNGVSIIIMIGILSSIPGSIGDVVSGQEGTLVKFVGLIFVFCLVIAGMVLLTTARRRINLEQQRRVQGNKVYGGQQTSVPLMLNHANVIPVIFASPVMVVIGLVFGWMQIGIFDYGQGGYHLLFAGLIIFFTYFYISITMDLNEMANHFKQAGFFVRGVRPGKKTVEYLQYRLLRITFVGAVTLALIAIVPEMIGTNVLDLGQGASQAILGGIGLLIVVGVTLDVIQKVSSFLMANQYQSMMNDGEAGTGASPSVPKSKGHGKGKRF